MKKVEVNQDLCIGWGACQAIVDKVFEIEDNGLATVKCNLIEQELEEDVVDAAEGCPTGAIIGENNEQ